MCFRVDPKTNEGACVPMCTGSPDNPVCPDGLECAIAYEDDLVLCLPPCDPLAPTCAEDEVCTHIVDELTTRFVCLPVPPFEPQPYAAPCVGTLVCDDGLACVDAGHTTGDCMEASCCTLLGDPDAPPACPEMTQTCLPLSGRPDLCFCGVPE
jgi:hypothetical protein